LFIAKPPSYLALCHESTFHHTLTPPVMDAMATCPFFLHNLNHNLPPLEFPAGKYFRQHFEPFLASRIPPCIDAGGV
jgi:hypothetical protein